MEGSFFAVVDKDKWAIVSWEKHDSPVLGGW
jgi:hypothetical protein